VFLIKISGRGEKYFKATNNFLKIKQTVLEELMMDIKYILDLKN